MKGYFAIGPQKTSTTWIYDQLQLNDVEGMTIGIKETFFYDRFYNRGWEWYSSFFKSVNKLIEIAPSYFISRDAALRIKSDYEEVKVLITLRDPVQRAISHFYHHYRKGRVTSNFWSAIKQYPEIIEASKYQKYIELWGQVLSHQELKVVIYEDMIRDERKFMDSICNFFDVDIDVIDETVSYGRSAPKYLLLAKLVTAASEWFRRRKLYSVINFAKKIGLSKVYTGGKPTLKVSEEDVKRLYEMFDDDINYICKYFSRSREDLGWRNG